MTRTLLTATCLALMLTSVACAPRRYHEHRRGAADERVDLNSASAGELARLPGIDRDDAQRIVANRPYPTPEALVRRGIIGRRAYDAIEDYVYAGRSRRERWNDERRDDGDDRHRRWYDDR